MSITFVKWKRVSYASFKITLRSFKRTNEGTDNREPFYAENPWLKYDCDNKHDWVSNLVRTQRQFERESGVVRLQDGQVVIQYRQGIVRVAEEDARSAGVVDVVARGRYQRRRLVQGVHELLQALAVQVDGDGLQLQK